VCKNDFVSTGAAFLLKLKACKLVRKISMKVGQGVQLDRTEKSKKGRKARAQIVVGIANSVVTRTNSFSWLEQVECKDDTDWIKYCTAMKVERIS